MFSIFSQFIFGNANFLSGANAIGSLSRSSSGTSRVDGQSSQSHKQHSAASNKSSSWKDKNLCFDLHAYELELELSRGERLIACFYPIEDVKGNQDELGVLQATNTRLIWICCRKRRVNLSIGWRTVSLVYEQNLRDALGGTRTSLFVLTKYESTKYEFVFNKRLSTTQGGPHLRSGDGEIDEFSAAQLRKFCQDKASCSLVTHLSPEYLVDSFEVVFRVWQAYKQTHLFRHCRTNLSNFVSSSFSEQNSEANNKSAQSSVSTKVNSIAKLPCEQIFEVFSEILLVESKSIKYVGTMMLSNVRLIWIDELLPMRNMSVPYPRIDSIKLKQGEKILVNTLDYVGSSRQAQFRLIKFGSSFAGAITQTPKSMYEQMVKLWSFHKANPRLGPESCEDCINYMSYLRPVEHLLDSSNASQKLGSKVVLNSSAQWTKPGDDTIIMTQIESNPRDQDEQDSDSTEDELSRHRTALGSYLEQFPIERDADLVYSEDPNSTWNNRIGSDHREAQKWRHMPNINLENGKLIRNGRKTTV